jgi:hypothetical protein
LERIGTAVDLPFLTKSAEREPLHSEKPAQGGDCEGMGRRTNKAYLRKTAMPQQAAAFNHPYGTVYIRLPVAN